MKKKTKSYYIRKLDKVWAEQVKLKADNECEYCGKNKGLNSHHIFSRSNKSVRWDISNGVSLCVGHHMFANISAHKAPAEFIEWLKETRGLEWYETLREKARSIKKHTLEDYRDRLEEFNQQNND